MVKKLKSIIRELLRKYPIYTSKEIIAKISRFSVVSFDIFDTLVNRNVVSPQDVFALAAKKCFDESSEIHEFQIARIEAEHKARKELSNTEEVSLDKIYEYLDKKFEKVKELLKQAEIDSEIEISYANPVVKEVYDWCLEHNKKIVLISDMYLDKLVIERILDKCDYNNYSAVYISSEIGLLKATSNLFSYVKKKLNLENNKWIHIGDSFKGDYLGARKNKISAIKIATNPSRTCYIKAVVKKFKLWRKIDSIFSGHMKGTESLYYKYGMEVLAPLLYVYSVWLHRESEKKQLRKLFFLARDGYLLQKVYQIIHKDKAIPNEYLYVSRRALRIPAFYTCNELAEYITFIPKNKFLSRDEVFDIFGLDSDDNYLWKEAGYDEDDLIFTNSIIEDNRFNVFYKKIESKSKVVAKESYEMFVDYLKNNDFWGNVGIVDVGWAGTIQKCLSRITDTMNEKINIFGFYVGLTKDAESSINGKGFIPAFYQPQVATAGLFEYPFLAHEGSLKRLVRMNGVIMPETCAYEYNNDEQNKYYINEIQNGVLDGVELLNKSMVMEDVATADEVYKALFRITKKPTLKESVIFGDMLFYDGASYYLAKPKTLLHYVLHYTEFIRDFSESGWKVGFLKRMMKIPFPYAFVLEKIKNRKGL